MASASPARAMPAQRGAPTATVRLNLLKGFDLRYGTSPAVLPRNAQRVLAYLALQDTLLPRDHVAQLLWMDVPDERAAANFRTALWRIHRLGFPVVESQQGGIQLAGSVVVDLRDVTARARRLLESGDVEEDAGLTIDALVAELLPGWYEDWLLLEQERFRQLRLHALEALCSRLTALRRYAEAVEAGLAAVASEPLRETAQIALIRAYLQEGNVIDAIRQYQGYRTLLEQSLGIEPGPALHELVRYMPVHRAAPLPLHRRGPPAPPTEAAE